MALMTAGAVETMVISPMPVAPRVPLDPRGFPDNQLHIKGGLHGGEFEGDPVFGLAVDILFPQGIADALVHAAFELAFQVLGMDDRARHPRPWSS